MGSEMCIRDRISNAMELAHSINMRKFNSIFIMGFQHLQPYSSLGSGCTLVALAAFAFQAALAAGLPLPSRSPSSVVHTSGRVEYF